MSRTADKMLEVIDEVDKLLKFNSQVFQGIKEVWGEHSKEFKMIQEIDSTIDDLLTLLNDEEDYDEDDCDDDDEDFNMEIHVAEFNRYQDEI